MCRKFIKNDWRKCTGTKKDSRGSTKATSGWTYKRQCYEEIL
ncbi:hypothetical protein SELSPUOL_01839 [Selenomonas sputigena ATCC 35185]|uniref:Uncharacterized protein n=1 Tax=Selenomonas sputigena (strain ATCC 35185 / DSM 20758 / CCUG 44933 / VPI D19B-28) TaxID=546271 RepID=C9LWI5_SELS3|nr:hypothetical protein SELSPUOL_01839 [Selenomonas sputigena ATCC 35185]